MLAIVTWTACLTWIVFYGLHRSGYLRISEAEERQGIDQVEHGGGAYHISQNQTNTVTEASAPEATSERNQV